MALYCAALNAIQLHYIIFIPALCLLHVLLDTAMHLVYAKLDAFGLRHGDRVASSLGATGGGNS